MNLIEDKSTLLSFLGGNVNIDLIIPVWSSHRAHPLGSRLSFVYFSIPGIIFGVLLKLNQKFKWVVKGKYDRYIANFIDGEYMDNEMVNILLTAYFILWPIYIPCFIVWIGGKELYHRYIKTMIYNMSKKKGGFFSIPTFGDKE